MLRYYEGMSAKEIAELLEMSPPAVDMRLSRGRALLREKARRSRRDVLLGKLRRSEMMTVLPPMNDPDKVDLLVSAHLQKTLDSQRGRAVAAFREHLKSGGRNCRDDNPMSFEAEARRRSMRMLRIWAGTASALAACLALVITLQFVHYPDTGEIAHQTNVRPSTSPTARAIPWWTRSNSRAKSTAARRCSTTRRPSASCANSGSSRCSGSTRMKRRLTASPIPLKRSAMSACSPTEMRVPDA